MFVHVKREYGFLLKVNVSRVMDKKALKLPGDDSRVKVLYLETATNLYANWRQINEIFRLASGNINSLGKTKLTVFLGASH